MPNYTKGDLKEAINKWKLPKNPKKYVSDREIARKSGVPRTTIGRRAGGGNTRQQGSAQRQKLSTD